MHNAVQKNCRMLEGEHSAILLTIEQPFSIKTFVLFIFKWPLKTGPWYGYACEVSSVIEELFCLLIA